MTDFLNTFQAVIPVTIVAGLWGIVTFNRNNRIKAAEILISLEKEYSTHIQTFLQLEYIYHYENIYETPIDITLKGGRLNAEDSEVIDKVDKALRYLFVCANVRRLSVDSGSIDRLCAYYLAVVVNEEKRPGLCKYVKYYWPTIYFWAPLAASPWPVRWWLILLQIPERLRSWWWPTYAMPLPQTEVSRSVRENSAQS